MKKSDLFDVYAFLFARKCFRKFNRGLFHASIRGLGLINFKDDNVSGERHFLRRYLSSCQKPTVFDVGANEGSYAKAALAANRSAQVFAFEPHPATYGRLSSCLSEIEGISAINVACGSAPAKWHFMITLDPWVRSTHHCMLGSLRGSIGRSRVNAW